MYVCLHTHYDISVRSGVSSAPRITSRPSSPRAPRAWRLRTYNKKPILLLRSNYTMLLHMNYKQLYYVVAYILEETKRVPRNGGRE